MGKCELSREKMIQNLKDAGCDDTTIEQYFAAIDAGDRKKAMGYIKKHREALLAQFHKCSDCIDCLDYFVMQTEKISKSH